MVNESLIKNNLKLINIYIKKYLNKVKSLGLERNDLYQEGLLGLTVAANTYNNYKNVAFESYASQIIERKIKDFIRLHNGFKHSALNESIPYENEDRIVDLTVSIESDLLAKELDEEIKEELTPVEYKVYELKKEGKTNKGISIILNTSVKNIENALQRIKTKMKNVMYQWFWM